MSRYAVRIARIRGVDVRLDPSLVLLALLFAWVFAQRFVTTQPTGAAWAMSAAGVVLLLASILAHEVAHALEAQHRGIEVEGITLLLFGGVTEMHAHSQRPRDEFVIAAVGPYVSLVCGAVFGLVATFASDLGGAIGGATAEVAGLLGWLNVALAVFNLVPGAPLDGGRVLRALVWWLTGSRRAGLRVSARVGQLLGLGLVALGGWVLLDTTVPPALGFWSAIIGAFLWVAAMRELQQSNLDDVLDHRRVADVMGTLPSPVRHDQTLDALDTEALVGDGDHLPVVDDTGELVGAIPMDEVRDLRPPDRSVRTAGDLMRSVAGHPGVDLEADLRTLVDRFAGARGLLRVEQDGRTVGVLSERAAATALHALRRNRGSEPVPTPRPEHEGRP